MSPKWKPHDGGHRSIEWLPLSSCRPLLRHRCLHTAAGGERAPALPCEENRETDATNQKAPPRVCLSSNIPVGDQMTVTFCNNCSAGNSGQMSLKSKGKQSCHCLFCFVLFLINVIPSSVCPHVCSIHLHVYYLIFTLFIEAIT